MGLLQNFAELMINLAWVLRKDIWCKINDDVVVCAFWRIGPGHRLKLWWPPSHSPTLSNFHPSHNFYSSHCFHSSRHFHLHENTRITSVKKILSKQIVYICATMLPLCSSESSFDLWMQQSLHPLHFYNSVTVCFKTVFGGFWTIAGNQHMVFCKWHMTLSNWKKQFTTFMKFAPK